MIASQDTATTITDRIHRALFNGAFQGDAPLTDFAIIRHYARANRARRADAKAQLRSIVQIAAQYRESPFDRHRLKKANAHMDTILEHLRSIRRADQALGRLIYELAPRIDAMTTMEQRLELLNCNVADRAELDEPNIGLIELIAAYCVEDSAAHRRDQYSDRPLYNAVNAEMMRVMFRTPEGRAASKPIMDSAFEPGGILHGVPTYYRQADGTMKRKAPSLVLHDAAGARVIEREPT